MEPNQHTCNFEGCEDAATHALQVAIPAVGHPFEPDHLFEIILGFPLCAAHAQTFPAVELLQQNPKSAKTVRDALRAAGLPPPDYARAEVFPIRLTGPEYKEFLKLREQAP